ncbi:MAG: efflux RND transporter periplasmic adaptor subunit [Desulfobacteraceae bacterium]|nr:efflux RND transporter periplasmic adaptor subunit [Desulfobacteraceae bacterium]MBU4001509.1 efflux RND transporter periplasmic adaptor subunit [Pseudomonadota bacterium]MBU4054989.1 efflux RND transporter periplasmic adaptor subunit [Pseudomonadota bacterium]
MKRLLFIILAIALIIGGVSLIKKRQHELAQTPLPESPLGSFQIQTVAHGTLPVREHYSGTLLARQVVSLAPNVQGRILAIHGQEGDLFLQGELLIQIDDREIRQEIAAMAEEVNQLESEFQLQQVNHRRQKMLFEQQAISQQSMDEAEAAYHQTRHRLESIKARAAAIRTHLEYTKITAPFDGIILLKLQEVGDMALSGKPVLTAENPEKGYKVRVNVPSKLTNSLHPGTEALLVSKRNVENAEISRVLPATEEGTNLGVAEILIKNRPFGLPSGASLGVDITVDKPMGWIIPERSVLRQKDGDYVFVINPENLVSPFKIQVLGWGDQQAVVAGELHEKDRVVVADESALLTLSAGQKIHPILEANP